MPAIQEYTPQVQPQITGGQRASPTDFGAGVAQAVESQSQAVGNSGDYLFKIDQQKQQLGLQKTLSEFRLQSMEQAQVLNKSTLPAGTSLVDAYRQDFQDRAAKLDIPPALQERAQEELNNMHVSYVGDAIQEQARQAGVQAKSDWGDIVIANSNAAAINPKMQDQAIASLNTSVQSLPLDPASKKVLLDEGVQKVRESAAKTVVQASPGAFLQQAKDGQWSDLKDLSRMLTFANGKVKADAVTEVAPRIKDAMAEAMNTGQTSQMPSRELIDTAYGPEKSQKIWDDYQFALSFGKDYSSIATLPPDQIGPMLEKRQPQGEGYAREEQGYNALIAAVNAREKALKSDPSGYVEGAFPDVAALYKNAEASNNPAVLQSAIALSKEKQSLLGIPDYRQEIISKQSSVDLAGQINGMKPQEGLQHAATLKEQYGDYWPDVYGHLVKAGLNDNMSVALTMDNPLQNSARAMLAEASTKEALEAVKKILPEPDKKTINKGVQEALMPFNSTVMAQPGNEIQARRTENAVTALANQYAVRGMDPDDAAKKAVQDVVGLKYNFAGTVRIPTQYDASKVQDGLGEVLALVAQNKNIDPHITGSIYGTPPEIIKQQYLSELKDSGYFVTNDKEDGVYIFDKSGAPVALRHGDTVKPFEIKFKDLENLTLHGFNPSLNELKVLH